MIKKKTRPAGGRNPRALYKRRPLTQAEKTPEPLPHPYMGGAVTLVSAGRYLPFVLWHGGMRGDFFNPSLKFAPTRSRTQDLRSVTEAT